MGVEYNALKAMSLIKSKDNSLKNLATIGRQSLQIKSKRISFFNLSKEDKNLLNKEIYTEKLFSMLGFKSIDSFDYSDYENATYIHDLNRPIDDNHKNKYDVVFDGGSLEHIFNFPVAIKNCMEMTRVGGNFVSVTVCNNFSGHGFYQFSPELFFRIFTKENGFELKGVYISEKNKWYKVTDPKTIQSRVTFKNKSETYIIVIAKKIDSVEIFEKTPQQSDYVECWKKSEEDKEKALNKISRKIKAIYNRVFVTYNKKQFKRIK